MTLSQGFLPKRRPKTYVIEEAQAEQLAALKQEYGMSISGVVREVIDWGIPEFRRRQQLLREMKAEAAREAVG